MADITSDSTIERRLQQRLPPVKRRGNNLVAVVWTALGFFLCSAPADLDPGPLNDRVRRPRLYAHGCGDDRSLAGPAGRK